MASKVLPAEARRIGLALLEVIGALHARGIVHRSVRPESVLLGAGGAVALLEPGAASAHGATIACAPELLVDSAGADARADLWAVGALLYELLAGRPPYRARHVGELMLALALSEPVPIQVHLPAADASIQAFFARALARDRAHRFPSARDMARALATVAIETAVLLPPTMHGKPTSTSGIISAVTAPGASAVRPIVADRVHTARWHQRLTRRLRRKGG